jgi:hypothetical protein
VSDLLSTELHSFADLRLDLIDLSGDLSSANPDFTVVARSKSGVDGERAQVMDTFRNPQF